jgi:enamine deaminase RidA (YjgF/YER057c/UK114 family)
MTTVEPDGWPRPHGYAHGVLAQGRMLAVAGQIGWNERGVLVASDFAAQAEQALRNVVTVVEAAGGSARSVVRLTWYVTDLDEYRACRRELGQRYRAIFGTHYPAMTLVQVAALLEPGAKVEIEATAVIDDGTSAFGGGPFA